MHSAIQYFFLHEHPPSARTHTLPEKFTCVMQLVTENNFFSVFKKITSVITYFCGKILIIKICTMPEFEYYTDYSFNQQHLFFLHPCDNDHRIFFSKFPVFICTLQPWKKNGDFIVFRIPNYHGCFFRRNSVRYTKKKNDSKSNLVN